ncbi:uncharacterized protein DS421_4g123750 [Arachis hypogaea]|nr:uncharacterized protein DS421_4g123750 [Arachis hypogaea]
MTRKGITHIIVILVVGVFICFSIVESHDVLKQSRSPPPPSKTISFDLQACNKQCDKLYQSDEHLLRECKKICNNMNKCYVRCNLLYDYSPKKLKLCIKRCDDSFSLQS